MFTYLEELLLSYASQIHLAIFSPLVSFIEEIIPPIPSPSVMIATGAMAQVQHYAFYSLFFLALLGTLGKTLGATLVYFAVDKIEDIFSNKITRFLGITHEQIEGFGARLSKSWKDYAVLIFLRAIPFFPSTVISVGSGLLRIKLKLFIISTLIGSFIRDSIYIYLGYTGTKVVINYFKDTITNFESIIEITVVIVVLSLLGYLYYKRRKSI